MIKHLIFLHVGLCKHILSLQSVLIDMIIIINDITTIVFCRSRGLFTGWMREALLTSRALKLCVKEYVHGVDSGYLTDRRFWNFAWKDLYTWWMRRTLLTSMVLKLCGKESANIINRVDFPSILSERKWFSDPTNVMIQCKYCIGYTKKWALVQLTEW